MYNMGMYNRIILHILQVMNACIHLYIYIREITVYFNILPEEIN